MNHRSAFIFHKDLLNYRFHDDHPFNQRRILSTIDLVKSFGLLDESQLIPPRWASDEELASIHDQTYIEMVKRAGNLAEKGSISHHDKDLLMQYGLDTDDNPVFPGIHEASALIVGSTLTAVDEVMSGRNSHALNLAGGLHHAFRNRAAGFCIYNDLSVAIQYLRNKYGARVLYIDTDAHHGDGVQMAFYSDENVMTVSFHETGKYLFPGTGNISEWGIDHGYGFSLNIPLEPYTEDDSFLETYLEIVPKVAEGFKPDVIITQNGCDAHCWDPLTHLWSSTLIYREIPRLAHQLAHEWCDGRWIATGGGGYDIWRVVPRAWAFLWAEMIGKPLKEEVLPQEWLDKWQKESPVQLPTSMLDEADSVPFIPRRELITAKNRRTMETVLYHIPRVPR